VLGGSALNQTLSGIQFDKFGAPTGQEIFVCDTWTQGFEWTQNNNHTQALFVKSGTMISDWHKWCQLVNTYPHKGLIAHIIWHPTQHPCLDDQCWFMNTQDFDIGDFNCSTVTYPSPQRSSQNLHDDYTPLWVAPGPSLTSHTVTKFGQGLIARQLLKNYAVVNWNNSARDLKFFLYQEHDLGKFKDYKNIAQNQLWIFNNEPITVVKKKTLLTPGSGLYWMCNIVEPATQEIHIVDISQTQVDFCRALWDTWDGIDYGTFVWDFIAQNNLTHYQLDDPVLTPMQRLKLKKKTVFVDYVNEQFNRTVGKTFAEGWRQAKQFKTVTFCTDNLVTWVLNNNIDKYDHIWTSNILNYKWTLLHTTVEQYNDFQNKLK
jgi:hypothetical protein